eukprot:3474966-Rhodomonas_salina.1
MAVVGSCSDLCEEDVDAFIDSVMLHVQRASLDAAAEAAYDLEKLEGGIEAKLTGSDESKWRALQRERATEMRRLEKGLFCRYSPDISTTGASVPSNNAASHPWWEDAGKSTISAIERCHRDMEELEKASGVGGAGESGRLP